MSVIKIKKFTVADNKKWDIYFFLNLTAFSHDTCTESENGVF